MCEERVESGGGADGAAPVAAASVADGPPAPPAPVVSANALEQEVALLRQEVARLDRELVDLRMDRRKAMLEELARLEEPLVERGALARRTRESRHRGGGDG